MTSKYKPRPPKYNWEHILKGETMSQREQLKQCGCGDSAFPIVHDGEGLSELWTVECVYCGIGVMGFEFESDAIRAWNLICKVEHEHNESREVKP